jgi:hypothetical protein
VKEGGVSTLLLFLWLAGLVQVAIAVANVFLSKKLDYHGNLSRVAPIIRQVFVVHSVYIVGVVLLFAAVLASGRGLGRCRAPVQLLYYDASLRRANHFGDLPFTLAALFLTTTYGVAALAHAS